MPLYQSNIEIPLFYTLEVLQEKHRSEVMALLLTSFDGEEPFRRSN